MTKKSKTKKQKNKTQNNKKEKNMHLDPIDIAKKTIRNNWRNLTFIIIPLSTFALMFIKYMMLHLYGIPREYIFPMITLSNWDIINILILIFLSIIYITAIETIINKVKSKILRVSIYLMISVFIGMSMRFILRVELFHALQIVMYCLIGCLMYVYLMRTPFDKKSRELAKRAFNIGNAKVKKFVMFFEYSLTLTSVIVLLMFIANVGVMIPRNHTTLDNKIVVASSTDKYLVSNYCFEYTTSGTRYILLDTNDMEIVKGGILGRIEGKKTFFFSKKF